MRKVSMLSLIFILSFMPLFLVAQIQTQTVKGVVIDRQSQELLIGATIQVLGVDKVKGTTSNIDGQFEITQIPVGRIQLQCDYLGYKRLITESFIINSAKQAYVEIMLDESAVELTEVTIQAQSNENRTLNEMVVLSGRSFSVEETERYAGSVADPSRMAVSFAGVQTSNDLDNDIVIRGNSSVGLLWRMEGIDIPNPNHFARIGSSGGGISIFSVNMLNNSDFIFGAMPAGYGNALSGVFDMRFRKGNKEKKEYSFRAGLLGLDLMAEGPIKKGQSSFLVNYRYSTLGILNKIGFHLVNANTDNTFSDLAFHLNFPSKSKKNIFQIWGIGGYSSEIHHSESNPDKWEQFDHITQTEFKTSMGVVGLNFTRLIDNQSYLKVKWALMGDHIIHIKDTIDIDFTPGFLKDEKYTTGRMTIIADYARKFNKNFHFTTGLNTQLLFNDLIFSEFDRYNSQIYHYIDQQTKFGSEQLIQGHLQIRWLVGNNLALQGGLHFLYWSLSQAFSVEPRLSISYKADRYTDVSLAYSNQSQLIPIGSYYSHSNNKNLSLMKSQQWVVAFSKNFAGRYKITLEGYYQQLSNIPVVNDPVLQYWSLNDLVGYSKYEITSDGKGRNYGLDLSLEKFFDRGYFFLFGLSVYNSEYSIDGVNYFKSRYAGNYNTSFMFGKEIQKANGNTFQMGFRNLLYGGQRYQPANDPATKELREYYLDKSSTLTEQNKMYWRADIRLAYRKNLSAAAWTLSLDVQNIFNRINTRDEIWNFSIDQYEYKKQAGIIPILSFQVDF